jgi:hypothetical protein
MYKLTNETIYLLQLGLIPMLVLSKNTTYPLPD